MLAVLPEEQKRGVGARLKWAQREEALARGVALITWTYDPLQARNANLNLRRLGATAPEFQPDFYGITTSSLHHGLPTDRLLVRWDLNAPRVRERAAAGRAAPDRGPALVPAHQRGEVAGRLARLLGPAHGPHGRSELLLEIPPDWDVLCQAAPRVAEDWHRKVRARLLRLPVDTVTSRPTSCPPRRAAGGARLYVLRKA